jgi:hypothetical protein
MDTILVETASYNSSFEKHLYTLRIFMTDSHYIPLLFVNRSDKTLNLAEFINGI